MSQKKNNIELVFNERVEHNNFNKLNEYDLITFHYRKGVNGFLGRFSVTSIPFIYMSGLTRGKINSLGDIKISERGWVVEDFTGNLSCSTYSDSYAFYEIRRFENMETLVEHLREFLDK